MDIFKDGQKIKKIFNPKRASKVNADNENEQQVTGHTLDRIVNAKEEARRQWEETQENFERRRREHEIKMIEMEKAECVRREKEIREQQEQLDEQRRKNRLVQEQFVAQIKSLQEKLEEYKLDHKAGEERLEDEISRKEDKLTEVKFTLEKRIKNLENGEEIRPTAPPSNDVYPNLPPQPNPRYLGASPEMSHSSRSHTPSDCSV